MQYYQDFATCAAVKGNGANVEYAMHLLHMAKGNIQVGSFIKKFIRQIGNNKVKINYNTIMS